MIVADASVLVVARVDDTAFGDQAQHRLCSEDLAEALDAPLFTADRRLTRATGPRCTFELLGGLD